MSIFKKAAKAVKKAGHQAAQNTVNAAVAPIEYTAVKPLQKVLPMAGNVLSTIQSNPALASALSAGMTASGLPGGLFSGGAVSAPDTGMMAAPVQSGSSNTMLYVGISAAVLLVGFLWLRSR